jgi:cyclopropane fatty-acyl-phospholipid synthase-like methyltransferase
LLRQIYFSLRYLGRPPWDTGIPPPEVGEFADEHTPGSALDLGCGTGATSVYLAERGWKVTGVDFVPLAIWKARRRSRHLRQPPRFRVGRIPELEGLSGPFDLVVDVGCFHSLPGQDRQRYVDRVRALLRSGGTMLLFAFTRGTPPGVPVEAVRRLFSGGFKEQGVKIDADGSAAWYTYQRS